MLKLRPKYLTNIFQREYDRRQYNHFIGCFELFQDSRTLSPVIPSEREIDDIISSLGISKACGPDGIGNRIIKMCSAGISSCL